MTSGLTHCICLTFGKASATPANVQLKRGSYRDRGLIVKYQMQAKTKIANISIRTFAMQ